MSERVSRREMGRQESQHLAIELAVSAYADATYLNSTDERYALAALEMLHELTQGAPLDECEACTQHL